MFEQKTKPVLTDKSLIMRWVQIEFSSNVKYFWVTLTLNLDWTPHTRGESYKYKRKLVILKAAVGRN